MTQDQTQHAPDSNRVIWRTPSTAIYSKLRDCVIKGESLLMGDFSVWFHPYNGDAPWRDQGPKA